MGFYKNSRSAYSRAEKALKKALVASMKSGPDNENLLSGGEPQDDKFVFTDMEEFVWVQLHQESHKQSEGEDVIMEEDGDPKTFTEQKMAEDGGWTGMHAIDRDEPPSQEEDIILDAWEAANDTGLEGLLNPSKNRGVQKDSVKWAGYIPRTHKYWPTLSPKELLFGYHQTSFIGRTLAKRSTCGSTKAK